MKKISHALRGLYIAVKTDRGVQMQILFTTVSLPLLYFVFSPLTAVEIMFLAIGYGLLFVTELQNTALERSLDRLHPEGNEEIRDSKDIAAGSVMLSLFIFMCLVILIAQSRGMI